jgi:hypothetical protein
MLRVVLIEFHVELDGKLEPIKLIDLHADDN